LGRRVVVVGSQCAALGKLSFLPGLAAELFGVLTDPLVGGCEPALTGGGLVLDPTRAQLGERLDEAFAAASADGATLVVGFVGHGETGTAGEVLGAQDFYLLPVDADPSRLRSETAFLLGQGLRERLRSFDGLDGLIVLVDACRSGRGATETAALVAPIAAAARTRFQLLAASDDRPAADGCFTRQVIDLLRVGVAGMEARIHPDLVKQRVRCPGQVAQWTGYDGRMVSSDPEDADPSLWLARNVAAIPGRIPLVESRAGQVVQELLVRFEPQPLLTGLVARVRRARWTTVTGAAGSGKSTLLAALCRPELTDGQVPQEFVHAAAFLDATSTALSLAEELSEQLALTVPGYRGALDAQLRHRHTIRPASGSDPGLDPISDPGPESPRGSPSVGDSAPEEIEEARAGFGPMVELIGDPLERTNAAGAPADGSGSAGEVRLALDGLDQLDPEVAGEVRADLEELVRRPGLAHLHVIVTQRDPVGGGPVSGRARMAVDRPDPVELARYLEARRVPRALAAGFADAASNGDGAWLLARLTADTYPDLTETERDDLRAQLATGHDRPALLTSLYDRLLDRALGVDTAALAQDSAERGRQRRSHPQWRDSFRPVLMALAAAGAGPVMPLTFLTAITGSSGGPATSVQARAVLAQLGRLIVRANPGTDAELVGLFHPTLVEHLAASSLGYQVDVTSARRVLLDKIEALVPITGLYTDNPLARWAADAEPEQLWQLGLHDHALNALIRRPLPTPPANLNRWTAWLPRLTKAFGPDNHNTLTARYQHAMATYRAGHLHDALRLFQELLPDRERVLGPQHGNTFVTRSSIASLIGQLGDAQQALRLFQNLLPDEERVLGRDHPEPFTVRGNIAYWTEETGDDEQALRLYRELLPDKERVFGRDHPGTLVTRGNFAALIAKFGNVEQALRLYRELLPVEERVFGPDHRNTLMSRGNFAALIANNGNVEQALRLYRELLPVQERVFGPDHPDSLSTRRNIAYWTGRIGNGEQALRLYRELLPYEERVFGPDHPRTLETRQSVTNLQHWLTPGQPSPTTHSNQIDDVADDRFPQEGLDHDD
jgi:tetratricopeptide (TPR) repeat protein